MTDALETLRLLALHDKEQGETPDPDRWLARIKNLMDPFAGRKPFDPSTHTPFLVSDAEREELTDWAIEGLTPKESDDFMMAISGEQDLTGLTKIAHLPTPKYTLVRTAAGWDVYTRFLGDKP
jgi:hypothetical protein